MEQIKAVWTIECWKNMWPAVRAALAHLRPVTEGKRGNKVKVRVQVLLVAEGEYEDMKIGPSSPLQFYPRDSSPLRLLRRRRAAVIPISPSGSTDPAA